MRRTNESTLTETRQDALDQLELSRKEVDQLAEAVQRAQAEGKKFESQRDDARRELEQLRGEHSRLLTAALEAQKKAGAKGHEDGQNAGIKLGRLLEKYGDDWTELTPEQQREREQRMDRVKTLREALQPKVQKLEDEISSKEARHQRDLEDRYEAGRIAGTAETEQRLQRANSSAAPSVAAESETTRAWDPRWLLYEDEKVGYWVLENVMEGSVARWCRIESEDVGQAGFAIRDAATWKSLDGGNAVRFKGDLTTWGSNHGATVVVAWEDAMGKRCRAKLKIPPLTGLARKARGLL